jgi:hypothetical protein
VKEEKQPRDLMGVPTSFIVVGGIVFTCHTLVVPVMVLRGKCCCNFSVSPSRSTTLVNVAACKLFCGGGTPLCSNQFCDLNVSLSLP